MSPVLDAAQAERKPSAIEAHELAAQCRAALTAASEHSSDAHIATIASAEAARCWVQTKTQRKFLVEGLAWLPALNFSEQLADELPIANEMGASLIVVADLPERGRAQIVLAR